MFGPGLQELYLGRSFRFENHKRLVGEKMQVDETADVKNIDQGLRDRLWSVILGYVSCFCYLQCSSPLTSL